MAILAGPCTAGIETETEGRRHSRQTGDAPLLLRLPRRRPGRAEIQLQRTATAATPESTRPRAGTAGTGTRQLIAQTRLGLALSAGVERRHRRPEPNRTARSGTHRIPARLVFASHHHTGA